MSRPEVKYSLSALDFTALLKELKPLLVGCYVSKIYQTDETLIVKLVCSDGARRRLVLSPKHGFWVTRYDIPKPPAPPFFCSELRRRLTRLKLLDLRQEDLDRILYIGFGQEKIRYWLVLEVVREGNIILLNADGEIMLALRYRKMRDRDVIKGLKYRPPPAIGIDVVSKETKEIINVLKQNSGKIAPLIIRGLGMPKEAVLDAIARSGLKQDADIGAVDQEKFTMLIECLKNLINKVKNGVITPVGIVKNNVLTGVYPFEPSYLNGETKVFNSFNEAVDEHFTRLLVNALTRERKEEDKTRVIAKRQLAAAEKYRENAKILRKAAEALFAELEKYQEMLNHATYLKRKGLVWSVIKDTLKKKYVFIKKVDLKNNKIYIEVAGTTVEMPLEQTAAQTASQLYGKAKELERKAAKAETMAEAIVKKSGREASEKPCSKLVLRQIPEKKWYERFRWFISSEGVVVFGGRDARQNEIIVRRYLGPDDIFLHADIYGGPAVIVKTGQSRVGEATIREAAKLAAAYSRAWKIGLTAVDVYWVKGSQVSKKAPSGEYLARGAFMVYGKRNYIRGVELELAVGVILDEKGLKLMAAPPSAAAAHCMVYVLLKPGKKPKPEIADEILSVFKEALAKKNIKAVINRDDVLNLLPEGSFYMAGKNK